MKKFFKYFLLTLLIVVILVPAIFLGPFWMRVQYFESNPADGYHAGFYMYVSPKAKALSKQGQPVTFLIQPNNSGTNSDDPQVHRKDAWWMSFGRHYLADDLGVALIIPAFVRPAKDWKIYTHALDWDVLTTEREDLARLDLQLIAMIETARKKLEDEGFQTRDKLLIQGYSASGMFANRFTALHPELVLAVAAGSPGGWPIAPVSSYGDSTLTYPAGIADLEELTGKPFNKEAYDQVIQLIMMGALDNNDSLDFTDGWEKEHAAVVDTLFGSDPLSRWDDIKDLYKQAGANAEFLLVDGVGHDRKALQHYSTEFFRKILATN